MLGRDRSTVANLLRLLRLPEKVQKLVQDRALSMGHARALVAVDDATARSLAGHLAWSARGLGVLVILLAIHRALAAEPMMAIATNALFALFIAALLLHLLWKQWRGAAAQPLLRAAGLTVLGVIVLTLVAGYPTRSAFVAARLVSIAAVIGLVYLLWTLGREWSESSAAGDPRNVALAADFGFSGRALSAAAVLTVSGMAFTLLLAVFVLSIGPS